MNVSLNVLYCTVLYLLCINKCVPLFIFSVLISSYEMNEYLTFNFSKKNARRYTTHTRARIHMLNLMKIHLYQKQQIFFSLSRWYYNFIWFSEKWMESQQYGQEFKPKNDVNLTKIQIEQKNRTDFYIIEKHSALQYMRNIVAGKKKRKDKKRQKERKNKTQPRNNNNNIKMEERTQCTLRLFFQHLYFLIIEAKLN